MSTSDDDRIAYLSGEPVDSLTPQERAELDELRGLLETPATWEEPDGALEDRIVSAIADEARRARPAESAPALAPAEPQAPRRRGFHWPFRRPALVLGGFATAAAAIVVAIVLAVGNSSPAPTPRSSCRSAVRARTRWTLRRRHCVPGSGLRRETLRLLSRNRFCVLRSYDSGTAAGAK